MGTLDRAREVLEMEIAGLRRAQAALGDGFVAAVERILACLHAQGKIVLTGVGKNRPIAQKIAATLTSTGSPAVVLDVEQAMHGDIGVLREQDVLLALSYSGESEELLNLLPIVRRMGVAVLALTGVSDSALARASDVCIPVPVDREACPFNLAPTVSTTATLAVGDALALVLLDARRFTPDDYARLHPGGAIGRTLLLCARDVMRTGERCASVRTGQTVRDAIMAMTSARAGSSAVVDADGRVLGIFTDGDLRRLVATGGEILEAGIDAVMTRNPVTVQAGQKLADVLGVYAQHEIDDLLVVDETGRLAGLLDIQQLPKLKVFRPAD